MEKIINIGEFKIVVSCNEPINHFLHCLNIYGLLGNHGKQYPLREKSIVKNSIDGDIFINVQHGDQYFSRGNLNIYKTGLKYILNNELWRYPIDADNVCLNITEMNFNKALEKSWSSFYKDYWIKTYNQTKENFISCINAFDFNRATETMMNAAKSEMKKDFYVFSADALKNSGITYGDNVCMGVANIGDDISFIHEGLHLLLNENWANNEDIINIIQEYGYTDKFYNSWKAKFEQALVIALDCLIQNKNDEYAKRYFDNCNVSNIYDIAYPAIKKYFNSNFDDTIENLMLRIIKLNYRIE